MSNDTLLIILALIPTMVFHEMGHALVAYWLGDNTAKDAGRITFNPLKHIDLRGSIIIPGLLAFAQIASFGQVDFMYGWAKPVPVRAQNLHVHDFRNPRHLMALVAIAGPITNFLLALLAGVLLHMGNGVRFLLWVIEINLWIGLFNLLPVPPLDGGRIVAGILPEQLATYYVRIEKLGLMVILLGIIALPAVLKQAGINFNPLAVLRQDVFPWLWNVTMFLTGNHGEI